MTEVQLNALIQLAEILHTHLRNAEQEESGIAMGPEPSDRVTEIINQLTVSLKNYHEQDS